MCNGDISTSNLVQENLIKLGCKESSGGNELEIDQEWLFRDFGGLMGDVSYNESDEEDFRRFFKSQNRMFS